MKAYDEMKKGEIQSKGEVPNAGSIACKMKPCTVRDVPDILQLFVTSSYRKDNLFCNVNF